MVDEGKVKEVVNIVQQMRKFKSHIDMCYPIIKACAYSNPIDVETEDTIWNHRNKSNGYVHFQRSTCL